MRKKEAAKKVGSCFFKNVFQLWKKLMKYRRYKMKKTNGGHCNKKMAKGIRLNFYGYEAAKDQDFNNNNKERSNF